MGKSGKELNLTTPEDKLPEHGIEYYRINRGGDVTYHGPGQITGYLIFDLELLYRDVHRFVREIEEVIIIFLAEYGLNAFRLDGYTGVWLGEEGNHRKICAIGVHLSRWVSMHGFALNINTNLDHFNHIVPCGIGEAGKSVTSLQQELGHSIDMDEAFAKLRDFTADVFKGKIVSSWN